LAELERLNLQKANNGRAMILVETAENHVKKGDVVGAVHELQEAVALSPDFLEAQYQFGLALLRDSTHVNSARAKAAFEHVLELDPNHAQAHFQLGLLLKAAGGQGQAAAEFEKATELAPSLVAAHLELARIASGSRNWEKAVPEFEAALAWSPEDAKTHYDLASALKASGHPVEAARELQIAKQLRPDLPFRP
jgi:tetratricopeptide (TPR) repeat protein